MEAKYLVDEGIVLVSKDAGEADKILTIFTKNFGKLEILAKNVKKLNSRRASSCNTLSYSKFGISKSKIPTLSEAVILDQFLKIRQNLAKLAVAFQALEVLNSITPAEVPNTSIFKDLVFFFQKLVKTKSLHDAKVKLAGFEIKLLVKTGWLGANFKIKNFPNFYALEKFLISKFEEISQRQLKSAGFAKMVLEGSV